MESDVIQLQDIFEFEIELGRSRPHDHGRSSADRPAPDVPREVPASAASSCRRACSASGSPRSTSAGARRREARRAHRGSRARRSRPSPSLPSRLGQRRSGADSDRVAEQRRSPTARTSSSCPKTQALTAEQGHRDRERQPRRSPRGHAPGRFEERCHPPHRRLEQHEGHSRSQGATVAARAFLGAAQGRLARRDHRRSTLQINVLSDFTTGLGAARGAQSPRRRPRPRAPTSTTRSIEASQHRQGRGARAHDFRPPLRRQRTTTASDSSLRRSAHGSRMTQTSASSRSGCKSDQYTPQTLKTLARRTGGTYIEADNPAALAQIYTEIGQRLSQRVRGHLPVAPPAPARSGRRHEGRRLRAGNRHLHDARRSTSRPAGRSSSSWIDQVITSPWLMIFIVVAVLALIGFAILTAIDVRNRSLRRRMAQYVTVPTEDESRVRRAEVAAMLAGTAQTTVGGQRWWQRFETDVELGGVHASPRSRSPAGRSSAGSAPRSSRRSSCRHLWGLLVGLAAPLVTRCHRLAQRAQEARSDVRRAASRQPRRRSRARCGRATRSWARSASWSTAPTSLPSPSFDASSRTSSSACRSTTRSWSWRGAWRATTPSRSRSSCELQREAGGNTAEVLDRVAEMIRGRMELKRLVARAHRAGTHLAVDPHRPADLRASSRSCSRGGDYLDPLTSTLVGTDRRLSSRGSWS